MPVCSGRSDECLHQRNSLRGSRNRAGEVGRQMPFAFHSPENGIPSRSRIFTVNQMLPTS